MTEKSIVSALCWVRRGHAKAVQERFQPDEEVLKGYKKMAEKV